MLGPIEVESGGRRLDAGPRQRRAVLAVLAVEAGNPVSVQALVDRVWGSRVPQAPRSSLYAHVSRLRDFLREACHPGGAPIELRRRDDGYVLELDRTIVDLHRFQQLMGMTAGTATAGEIRTALLREALALWRGPPLLALSSDWAARVRRSVESQFVGVAGAWATETIRAGRPAEVADLLARLVGLYPMAEQLVAQQMRALCALDRTAEALQLFADTQAQLADRLGAEPGPEVRRLHVAVLRGEIGRPGSGAGRGSSGRPPPRQVAVDRPRLVGRHPELAWMVGRLSAAVRHDSPAVITVYGGAGAGKSALALHAATRLATHYPDGQLYLDLRGFRAGPQLEPAHGLTRLLLSLGAGSAGLPRHVEELAAIFQATVSGRRLLLVLDNAADAAQVRPLLPSGLGCAAIVTSRSPLFDLGDAGHLRLDTLSIADGVELLRQWIGPARVAAEPEAAAAIARLCEGLPLALRIAGSRLATRPHWPLGELRERLADERRRLDTLELDGVGLRASLSPSYRWLSHHADPVTRAAAVAYARLGAQDLAAVDRAGAAALLGTSEASAERLMERLVDAQLLDSPAPGVYRMRDLMRLHAREQLGSRGHGQRAADRPNWWVAGGVGRGSRNR